MQCIGGGLQKTGGTEAIEDGRGEALEVAASCGREVQRFGSGRDCFGAAGKFVETDGDGLTEIHGAVLFAGGDAQKPMAMAEVLVGEAALFGTEKKGDAAESEALADEGRGLLQTLDGMLGFAAAEGRSADD